MENLNYLIYLEDLDSCPEPHHVWCDPDDSIHYDFTKSTGLRYVGHQYPLCCDYNCPACLRDGYREMLPEERAKGGAEMS